MVNLSTHSTCHPHRLNNSHPHRHPPANSKAWNQSPNLTDPHEDEEGGRRGWVGVGWGTGSHVMAASKAQPRQTNQAQHHHHNEKHSQLVWNASHCLLDPQ